MHKTEMEWKQRKKNKCDVVDCTWSCTKCGFNPVVKEERLRKRFHKGEKSKMNYLTEEAWELVHKAPHVVNKLAEEINKAIENIANGSNDEEVEIAHVVYSDEQIGREK